MTRELTAQEAKAIDLIIEELADHQDTDGAPIPVAREMARVLIDFIKRDHTNTTRDYGYAALHTTVNAWSYAPQIIRDLSPLADAVIAGCFIYLQHGADDYHDTVETSKVLAVFEAYKAEQRRPRG